jgi:hypothetical protein
MVGKRRRDKQADSGYLIESIEYVSPTSLPLNTKLHQREARERLLARTRQRIKDRFESLPDETEID